MTPAGVTALRRAAISHLALRSPDPDRAARFYEDVVGLVLHDVSDGVTRLGWGRGHHVLELREGPLGVEHFGVEVLDAGGPTAVAERLAAAGIATRPLRGEIEGIEVDDPDGNRVQLHGRVVRAGEHGADTGRRPIRLQHVTFGTARLDEMVRFYGALGWTVTDRMADGFVWMRSHVEHHSVAVVATGRAELDHFSFDLAGWEDFKAWPDRLTDLGVPVTWGPGRHGPGNNLFVFFGDPDGRHIELSAEMEKFWPKLADYEARVWVAEPATINLWGGQLATWREVA